MTDLEMRAITALRSVKMPEKNWHARRAEILAGLMTFNPGAQLKSSQTSDLWFLVWRYRRQIADKEIVAHANWIENGVLHLAL